MASQWATMVDDGHFIQTTKGGAERVLTQDEIDSLLGFSLTDISLNDNSGIRAIIDSAMVSYERLPMLEIIFDRLVRLMTTSLRNFTSDNVEVSLDRITSVRFGDYLNSIPLPAILGVFKAEEWDNFGLVTVNSSLIYSIIDVLLGGRRGQTAIRIEGRPYTTIETNLVKRMIEVVLADAELAFKPLSPVKFNIDRLETNPRFAAISRPANAAILVRLRIDMEDRGGNIELLLPYATIEPIRDVLLQMFMGEKFGRDPNWEGHLATELGQAEIAVDAVLYEARLPLKQIMKLDVGDTLMLELKSDAPVIVRCGDVTLTEGRMGRVGDRVAVRVGKPLAQADHDLCDVRIGGRLRQSDGGTMTNGIGIIIDGLVAILLVLTIGYCMMLNRRLKLLKADEQSLRATISELVTATEIAERAIGGLKLTVHECDTSLGERLRKAERVTIEIERSVVAGKELLGRLSQIVTAGRGNDHAAAPSGEARQAGATGAPEVKSNSAPIEPDRRQSRGRGGGSLRRAGAHQGAWSRGMIRYIRDLRLIPIALIASACLLTLKVADIALHGSSLFAGNSAPPGDGDISVTRPMPDGTVPSGSQSSWAQQMFNFPDGSGAAAVPSTAPLVAAANRR